MPHQPRDRSRRLAILLTAILVATTVLAGPASAGGAAKSPAGAPTAPAAVPQYDGEALFRGIFFRQGPVAARYPELARAPVAPTGAEVKLTDRLVGAMRQLEPGFFRAFEAGVTSGDRFRVRATLARAEKLLVAAAERSGVRAVAKGEARPGSGTCYFVFVYKVVTLATAANFVLAINFAYNVNVYTSANFTRTVHYTRRDIPELPTGALLSADQWVDQVAATLAR